MKISLIQNKQTNKLVFKKNLLRSFKIYTIKSSYQQFDFFLKYKIK